MDNYQLYRTNVKLGGQMKMDLILTGSSSGLFISDYHITPISKNIPFRKLTSENLLNYDHRRNISVFYNQIKKYFYDECTDKKFLSPWPIIVDNEENVKNSHDNTYEMGCRRMNQKLYGKQFEFLCPIWIEHIKRSENEYLGIKISIKSSTGHELASKTIRFKDSEGKNQYHNKFINYFDEYLKYVGILGDNGNDDVISIRFNDNKSQYNGIKVDTGILTTYIDNSLVSNLISRERPLLEFDNMIIRGFENNKMITSQLFNLNLCFNIEDIISPFLIQGLMGQSVQILVQAGIVFEEDKDKYEFKPFEIVDFYSNFEFIPRKICGSVADFYYVDTDSKDLVKKDYDDIQTNVLDYLQDYKYIDLISKNKFIQSTIHWSLVDNNDYIFNIYDGFAGVIRNFYTKFKSGGEIVKNYKKMTRIYDNSPSIYFKNYKPMQNSIGWCNMISIPAMKSAVQIIENSYSYMSYASDFSKNWVNNLKREKITDDLPNTRILLVYLDKNLLSSNNSMDINDDYFEILNFAKDSNNKDRQFELCIFSTNLNDFTLKGLIEKIEKEKTETGDTKKLNKLKRYQSILKSILETSKLPTPLITSSSLDIIRANSPSLSTTEIQYLKSNKSGNIVERYDGKIKPTFIKSNNDINFNYVYRKHIIKQNEYSKSIYSKYSKTGFTPLFPSVGYDSILKDKFSYNDIPDWMEKYKSSAEYHWFNLNKLFVLKPYLEFNISGEDLKDSHIQNKIGEIYNLDDEIKILYIYSLYDKEISFDYEKTDYTDYKDDEKIVHKYNYTVKLTLK